LNILTHTFDAIWNSKALQEVRSDMLAGKQLRRCDSCFSEDTRINGSMRDDVNYALLRPDANGDIGVDIPEKMKKNIERSKISLKPVFQIGLDELMPVMGRKPKSFDLRVDNKCNLACVICNPRYSSLIEDDPVHARWSGVKMDLPTTNRFNSGKNWARSEELTAEILDFANEAEYVQMAGGEPFVSRVGLAWLKHMVETGQSRSVDLTIFTNAQHITPRIIDQIATFRTVRLILSIDAYGEQYEYVRYPGKWANLETNVGKLLELQSRMGAKIVIMVNFTLSIYTCFSIRPMLDWCRKTGVAVILSFALGPDYVSLYNLPGPVKEKVTAELEKIAVDYADMNTISSQADRIIELLKKMSSPFSAQRFMRFTNEMDKARGTDFHKTFPDMSRAYKECGPWTGDASVIDYLRHYLRHPRMALDEIYPVAWALVINVGRRIPGVRKAWRVISGRDRDGHLKQV
jgi:MoaA/NifB/PqqE/SkfB family radical SAM enzyme